LFSWRNGRKRRFSRTFDLANIPYVGSGVLASATGMDKVITKQLFTQNNLPITKYYWFYRNAWEKDQEKVLTEIKNRLIFPLFIKPAAAGSSIGVSKAKTEDELKNAIEVALIFDRKIIIEEAFTGREINIPYWEIAVAL